MAYARLTDPETSHEAAASVKDVPKVAETILYCLQSPMTDVELVNAYNAIYANGDTVQASESGIRTKRNELWKQGKVVDTGHRKKTPSGRNAIVWQEVNHFNSVWWIS